MKEITRRLYTKPVMLGMAFLMGMALVVGLFVTSKSTAAPNSFPVAAGNDEFETAADGETYHDFAGAPIPANFFGSGSLAYGGLVALQGVPLSAGSNVDTIIQRHQSVAGPGGSTGITMTGLSLKSTSPITVTYSNNTTETWNVKVGLSIFKASSGTMTINSSTFDSTLKVWPRFTFTRVSDGATKVFDTGGSSGLATAQSADSDSSSLMASQSAVELDDRVGVIEPAPAPLPAPCPVATISDSEFKTISGASMTAAASTSCAPITLSSTGSPWGPCANGGFCIPVPITEEERWARHRPGPRGTIKGGAIGVAE
jgi:hypothetical protein